MREIKNLDALELSEALLDTYKCVHGFGFNGHFISLMPTKHYYYLAYKHRVCAVKYSQSCFANCCIFMWQLAVLLFYNTHLWAYFQLL